MNHFGPPIFDGVHRIPSKWLNIGKSKPVFDRLPNVDEEETFE
jgi:hypothetical protein